MDSPPWQCPCAWCVKISRVRGKELRYDNGPFTLFNWLSPLQFLALSKIKKNALKGQRFADLSDIQRNVKTLLRGIPGNDFQDCFRQWHHTESISKVTAALSAQVRKFCFHRAIPGIKWRSIYLHTLEVRRHQNWCPLCHQYFRGIEILYFSVRLSSLRTPSRNFRDFAFFCVLRKTKSAFP